MTIELSDQTFTNQADRVPVSGVKKIVNTGITNTLAGDDVITGIADEVGLVNYGNLNTNDGNDTITGNSNKDRIGINNASGASIRTGDGHDTIICNGDLKNASDASIRTGDGFDLIICYGVIRNEGLIGTGDGNDALYAYRGFKGSGSVDLGNGDDYILSSGECDLSGGRGNDGLELTSGTYKIGRSGRTVTFTKGNQLTITSEFETFINGGITYDFSSLKNGQVITVA
jgi:hypothetical protein